MYSPTHLKKDITRSLDGYNNVISDIIIVCSIMDDWHSFLVPCFEKSLG